MVTNSTGVLRSEVARLKVENNDLLQEVHRLREFVDSLNSLTDITDQVKTDADILPLLHDIFYNAQRLLNTPDGTLALLDPETDELVFVIVHGDLEEDLTGYRMPSSEGIAGWVVKNQQPALVRDVRRDTRFFADVDEKFKFNTQSLAAAPLIGNQRVLGVIEVLNQPGDTPFSDYDMALLKLLCRFAGEALADLEQTAIA